MKAETTRRPFLLACARALRMKCTRQRCQLAPSTLAAAALRPSWASEMTSLTPRSPRRASLCRNSLQNVSASEAQIFAAAVAVDADRDDDRHRGNWQPLPVVFRRGTRCPVGVGLLGKFSPPSTFSDLNDRLSTGISGE